MVDGGVPRGGGATTMGEGPGLRGGGGTTMGEGLVPFGGGGTAMLGGWVPTTWAASGCAHPPSTAYKIVSEAL